MMNDPCERTIAEGLANVGIAFQYEVFASNGARLDFYLQDYDLYIECKQFHSDRIDDQIKSLTNVIVVQGLQACKAFGQLLNDLELGDLK